MSEAKKVLLGLLIGLAITAAFVAIIAAIIALNKPAEHSESTPPQPQAVAQRDSTPAPEPAKAAPAEAPPQVAQQPAPKQSKPATITPAKAIQPFWTTKQPTVVYNDKYDVNSTIISAYYSTDKEMLGSIAILYMSKGPKPTKPTPLSPTTILVIWPHADKAPQQISFGKGQLYDCAPWRGISVLPDKGEQHGVTILLKYGDLYNLVSDDEIIIAGDQQPIFTLDKKVKLAIKAYLEANGQLPEGVPIELVDEPQPVSTPPAKLDGLSVVYYGPNKKTTPDKTMVNLDLGNVFSSPYEELSLWIFYDHRTPQRIPDHRMVSVGIDRFGPSYEYTIADKAVIRSGDTLLGEPVRCNQKFDDSRSKNSRYNEWFYMDVPIKALKQALDSDQSIRIQVGDHPATTLNQTCRATIKQFIEILQSGSYPAGTLKKDTVDDEPKASGFGKPLSAPPSENTATEALTVDLLDTTWETSGGYIYIYVKIRNTSNTALKYLKVTATLEREDNSLILTNFSYLEPTIIESGAIALSKLMIKANPLIHHYNLTFEANGREVKFKNRTI